MNGFKNHAGLSLTMMCGLASAQNISDGCGASNTQERTRNHNFKEERKKHPPTHLLNFHQTKRKCFCPSVVQYEYYFYTIQQS